MDLVFIDGSHAFDYVKNDTRKAMELLRDGRGVIIWHDYGDWDGVTLAVNELYRQSGAFRGLRRCEWDIQFDRAIQVRQFPMPSPATLHRPDSPPSYAQWDRVRRGT